MHGPALVEFRRQRRVAVPTFSLKADVGKHRSFSNAASGQARPGLVAFAREFEAEFCVVNGVAIADDDEQFDGGNELRLWISWLVFHVVFYW